jgi:hypothetical protein
MWDWLMFGVGLAGMGAVVVAGAVAVAWLQRAEEDITPKRKWTADELRRSHAMALDHGFATIDDFRYALVFMSFEMDKLNARLAALEARTAPSEGAPVPDSHQHETPASGPLARKDEA